MEDALHANAHTDEQKMQLAEAWGRRLLLSGARVVAYSMADRWSR